MDVISIIKLLEEKIGQAFTVEPASHPITLRFPSAEILNVTRELHQNPAAFFDQLSCVTGVDNGPQANTLEVIYHLYSIPFNQSLALKVILPRENPEVESVVSVWRGANWLEREVFDMYGIRFLNHPDLRRILLPADWVGHPLRKDYQHQELYRDVTVKA